MYGAYSYTYSAVSQIAEFAVTESGRASRLAHCRYGVTLGCYRAVAWCRAWVTPH